MLQVFLARGDVYRLLSCAAKQVWGWDALPEIVRLPGGKPVFSRYPRCHFSLSHSGDLALAALSDAPVGCDVERLRPRREALPAYVFRGADYDRFLALGGDWGAFYTLWTQVESIVKYTGEGLRAYRRSQVPEGCELTRFQGENWRACVCGHGEARLRSL